MSYENTMLVRAIDEEGYYKTAVGVVLSLLGVIEIAASGGSLTPIAAAQIAGGLAMAGIELKDYLTDNGDGTYTMSATFIAMVLDEARKLEDAGFHDYKSIQNYDGTYNVVGYSFFANADYNSPNSFYFSDTVNSRPFCIVIDTNYYMFYVYTGDGMKHSESVVSISYKLYIKGVFTRESTGKSIGGFNYDITSVNIPVFASSNDAHNAFANGDFSSALNYREKPLFEYGSVYAPVYNGGSVTFRKEVLDGFEDKLQEVNDKYDDVDDKVNALYDYILNYDGSGDDSGGNSGSGDNSGNNSGSSDNYDSILDAILDYLKKIYSGIKDILEEIKDFDFSDWLRDISSSLKEISGQIKDFHDVVESMDRLNDSLQELSGRMDDNTYGQEIKDLLQQILDELRDEEGQDFDGVVDSMESIDDKLQELLDLIGDDMSKDDIEDILQQILDALNNDGVIDGMESIDDKLQELLDSINGNMSRDDIEDILQQILEAINNQEGQDLDGVIDGMENIEDKLQELLDSFNDNMSKEDIEDILQQILDEMRKQEGLDGVNERLDSLDETLNEILKELRNSSNYDGLFGDLISLLSKILDDPETGSQDMVDALSSSLGELASGLTEKFPFSIPWDIQAILLGLADTPKAPRFELPIVVERYGIDEKVVIDMEMFETLSDLSRSFFSVLFAMFLINLTFKVVGMKKED